MSKPSALDILIQMSKELLDNSSIQLASARRSEDQARTFLDTLRNYRDEYIKEMQRLMQNGMDAMTVGYYRDFLRSLDSAISQATQTIEREVKTVEKTQDEWRENHGKHSSFNALKQKRTNQESQINQRKEQRESDAMASRSRHLRSGFSTSFG